MEAERICEKFNSDYGIGQEVRFWTGERSGAGRIGNTWTEAHVLGGHTPVVYIRDSLGKNVGCVALTHVQPLLSSMED